MNGGESRLETQTAGPNVYTPRSVLGISRKGLYLAVDDLVSGVLSFRIWVMLAWNDVRQRYRRSVLGPFWLTISTAVMVGGMGPLFAKLFNQQTGSYLGFLAVGFVVWQLLAQIIADGCHTFISSEAFIKQIKLPLSVYVLRTVWKSVITFGHNLVVVAVVFVFLPPTCSANSLLFPLAILAVAVNGVWVSLILGMLCARFRDIPQIVASLLQVAFFLTPVMWQPQALGRHTWTTNLNPFYHFIEIMRGPLLGAPFAATSWIGVVIMTICGYAVALAMYSRYRSRIAYWV